MRTRFNRENNLQPKSVATITKQGYNATYPLDNFKGLYKAKEKCPLLFDGIIAPVTLNGFGRPSFYHGMADIKVVCFSF